MKVFRVTHISGYYPPHLGGAEIVVSELAHMQSADNVQVEVVTSNHGQKKGVYEDGQIQIRRLRSYLIANTPIMLQLLPTLLKLKKGSVLHVHVAQAYAPEMVFIASKLKGLNYIAHVHLDVGPTGKAGFLLKLYKPYVLKYVLRAADKVVVFDENQRQDLIKKYGLHPTRITSIPNGVGKQFYYNKARQIHKKPRLLFVGRLDAQKNLPLLLHALEGVSNKFETNIVGTGALNKKLELLVKKLNLKNVNFLGRRDGEELLGLYREADLFVQPSEREGMPLVLLEAMAMGLPIIATDVSGNRELVKNEKNGLLVPLNNPELFKAAVIRASSDRHLYTLMSNNSFKMAQQYSWDRVSADFAKVYEEIK
jgi:glycosyltransferase involved in cell wall biosynthesis